MSEIRQETIETYNHSAEALSAYFQGIGARTEDIELAFHLSGIPKPKVIEIGCGDGRDAKEIVASAGWYLGFDISENMVELAEKNVPEGMFEVADAVSFTYPPDIDIVFAFASLLHIDKTELETVFYKVAESLKPGGIFFISTKYAPECREEIKDDEFGRRLFFFYNQRELEQLAGDNFETLQSNRELIGKTEWIEIIFKRAEAADV